MKKMIILYGTSIPLMFTVTSLLNTGNESIKICELHQPVGYDKKVAFGGYRDV